MRIAPAAALLGALLLSGCSGDPQSLPAPEPTPPSPSATPTPSASASPSPSPSASPTATVSPSASPRAKGRGLVLGGDDLGVTRVGAPVEQAVRAVSAVLGPPRAQRAKDSACISAEYETAWNGFRLAVNDGRVSGWVSTSRQLATPAGVTLGTRVSTLQRVYGDRLDIDASSPDTGVTFGVEGVSLRGRLSSSEASGTVESFANGACTGP